MGGVAPDLAPFVSAFIDLRRERTTLPLNLRLRASFVLPETQAYAWGTTEVRAVTAALEACPWSWSPVHGIDLLPCAGFEAGPLIVEGHVNELGATSSSATWWWADATAGARAEWAVGGALHLELQGGALFPLTHNTYVVNRPETPVYSAPPATLALLVGARLELP